MNTKLSKDLATKNREIDQLKTKIDKLERDLNNAKGSAGSAQEEEGNFKRGKRQAQIEEPSPQNVQLVKTDKSKATAELLKNALKECDLLRRLEISHIEGIVYHCPGWDCQKCSARMPGPEVLSNTGSDKQDISYCRSYEETNI